jgi:hypothetical protein
VPRKKRTQSRSARRIHGGGIRDDRYLLDEFTTQDLRRWKRNSNLLNEEYLVRQFYELENLRALSSGGLQVRCTLLESI